MLDTKRMPRNKPNMMSATQSKELSLAGDDNAPSAPRGA
jgi:hypothetical protein